MGIQDGRYGFPHMSNEDLHQLVVVDPLNMVLWGANDPDEVLLFIERLPGWAGCLLSSHLWGVVQEHGSEEKIQSVATRQQARSRWKPHGVVILTNIAGGFARHHVRIFRPAFIDDDWGHVALVGAHTERLGFVKRPPFVWHRISDWIVARELFTESLRLALGTDAIRFREFPHEGRWQGHHFDGNVIFVRLRT